MSQDGSEVTDEALMLRYQRGDRQAFASLVKRHKKPLFNFVFRRLGSYSSAQDITQESFLRVVRNASEFKHEARFSTWLYAIARNLCIDDNRKMALRRHASLDAPAANDDLNTALKDRIANPHPEADVERSAARSRVQARIIQAVTNLPDEQKEVFLLRELANPPFGEIAHVVGVGENTVKSRMRYALERLRDALSEFEEYARALK